MAAVSNLGYVRLHRKMLDSPIWTQLAPAVSKVATYFMLRAGYREKQWYDGSETITLPAGSFVTSIDSTARACHISRQQTRDAFEHLRRTHFATYRRTHRYTVVTVLNWSSYQASSDEGNTVGNTEENLKGTLNKKTRSNSLKPCASGDAPDALYSIDDPPFETTNLGTFFEAEQVLAKSKTGLSAQQAIWFNEWWPGYWRKKAKKAAERAFQKHVRTAERFARVMAATRAQSPEMLKREPSKQPHGATWLNDERWEDEPDAAAKAPQGAADDYEQFPHQPEVTA